MLDWRTLPPVFEPFLSSANLLAEGFLFWIGDAILQTDTSQPRHWHEAYEIGYAVNGPGVLVIGEREHPYQAGQVYVISDLEPHVGFATVDGSVLFVVHFHPHILEASWLPWETQAFFTHGLRSAVLASEDTTGQLVRDLLEKVRQESNQRAAAWEVVVGGLLIQAMGLMARRFVDHASITHEDRQRREALMRIGPALHLVEQAFDQPLTLNQMAEAAHLSRSHCCALFQTALNTTPIAYRNTRRILESRRFLQQTDLTIAEIAYRVGFSSVQEFNRMFRRAHNTTPGQFRRVSISPASDY